ncbi:o-succinylbenzoate--CoA ligase [Microbacterium terrisoli]|uniref:o-succinylbenzoate--CoA ligase n=1 Tax=Microbacterium terrisoli TaxID=3242192 RepID=UPI002803D46D|nr:o-succinylbenzoate--CoA ligase [Microbacterium protaetiae]
MLNYGIGTWVNRRAQRMREDAAIAFRDQRIGYNELDERILRLADALRTRGVQHGDRVAYLGNNHPSFVEALFATTMLGAIFVPLNTRLAAPEIEFAVDNSGAETLIFQNTLGELARAGTWSTAATRRICVGETDLPGVEDYDAVVASGAAEYRDNAVSLDDAALILYTSGTTGYPKGAVLTHGNLTWNTFNALVDYGLGSGEVVLLISPMFHVASLGMGALPILLQGGTVILREKFDPGDVLHTIESEGVTMLSGVPTTYQMIEEHPDWAATDLSSLRHLTCGGSTMPQRMLEAYEKRGLHFSCGYGMTETSPGATAMPPHMSIEKMGSSGLKQFFTDVKVVDEDGGMLPPGEVGEILVSGPNVIHEYWLRPEATAEAIVDGWLHTGDLGYLDEDGYLFVVDRLKDMIISGGENIYSAEVEGAIMQIPEVSAVALIGVPDAKWGEVPLAVATLDPGATITPADVIARLQGRLAKYKIPREVVFVDELPRTASGKIRKAELRKAYAS